LRTTIAIRFADRREKLLEAGKSDLEREKIKGESSVKKKIFTASDTPGL